jgi:hypothetical protein
MTITQASGPAGLGKSRPGPKDIAQTAARLFGTSDPVRVRRLAVFVSHQHFPAGMGRIAAAHGVSRSTANRDFRAGSRLVRSSEQAMYDAVRLIHEVTSR